MRSDSDKDIKLWDYLRIIPAVKPYTLMKPLGDKVFELVILDGLRSNMAPNSNDPPQSFHTKDIFQPHQHDPDLWKYTGRLDDRVTLMNGEKVLPTPIEGRIRQHPAVKEAVVVGVGKALPGLLIFRKEGFENMLERDFLETIWPAVDDANNGAEEFSQIGREMIRSLPPTKDFPQTDKGTILRARLYQDFASEISSLYGRMEDLGNGRLKLEVDQLETWLLHTFRDLKVDLKDVKQDFFAAGVDSLQALRMLSIIKAQLDLNGSKLNMYSIYDTQNIQQLAQYLHRLRNGEDRQDSSNTAISTMCEMIDTYSRFDTHDGESPSPTANSVLLTGGTGFLGSHLLDQLVQSSSVARVYCPVRASSPAEAHKRLISSLAKRRLATSRQGLNKIHALHSDFSPSQLPSHLKAELSSRLTHVIHCAWPVNFNIPLQAFEDHIRYLQGLLQLSLSTRSSTPAHLIFCSSISAASNHPSPVPEAQLTTLDSAAPTGYGQSKLVAEKIIKIATEEAGAHATVLRIGQIVGDTVHGMWNENEAIPLMVRSAMSIHSLPALDEQCAWLPVDTVARSVLDFSGLNLHERDQGHEHTSSFPGKYVFNLVNPFTFSWKNDFLPALRAAGLQFETMSPEEWLRRLRDGDQDLESNPALKLLEYWSRMIEVEGGYRQGPQGRKVRGNSPRFDTALAENKSTILRSNDHISMDGLVAGLLDTVQRNQVRDILWKY